MGILSLISVRVRNLEGKIRRQREAIRQHEGENKRMLENVRHWQGKYMEVCKERDALMASLIEKHRPKRTYTRKAPTKSEIRAYLAEKEAKANGVKRTRRQRDAH